MNTELRKQARKHRDLKLATTDKIRNRLVSEPNYHAIKWFSEGLLVIEMEKTKVKMNKPVYLGLSILEISKTLMYEFWYDYINPKHQDNAKFGTWIQTVFSLILKQKISMKILQMMLKKDLIHKIMNAIDHYLNETLLDSWKMN